MKMSKSESGKLGAEKSKLSNNIQKQNRIIQYDKNPNQCLNCNAVFRYEKRHNKFCNQICSAIYTNKRKDWTKIRTGPISSVSITQNYYSNIITRSYNLTRVDWKCLNCNIIHTTQAHRVGKYCNNRCKIEYEYKEKVKSWLYNYTSIGVGAIKKYLKETYGNACSECGIKEWNNKSITLELEHKDGNSDNNRPENLCLLCPNCHSQTPTYRAKNKGNGRHARRQRYAEGKSY